MAAPPARADDRLHLAAGRGRVTPDARPTPEPEIRLDTPPDSDFRDRMRRVETLVARAERLDPAARDVARELTQSLLELHGAGLAAVLDTLARGGGGGRAVVDALTRDRLISSLLLLHDLHPHDLPTRVRTALDAIGPALADQGGVVELVEVTADGTVRVRVTGKAGCGGTLAAVRAAVEDAVGDAAPDATAVRVEVEDAPVLVPLGVRGRG